MKSSSEQDLQAVLGSNFSTLLDYGILKPATSFSIEDKVDIVHAIALHHVILRSKAEMDQFCDGLQSCGVLNAIRNNSSVTRSFFTVCGSPKLTTGIR